jgi:hypothetical protein
MAGLYPQTTLEIGEGWGRRLLERDEMPLIPAVPGDPPRGLPDVLALRWRISRDLDRARLAIELPAIIDEAEANGVTP